MRLRVLASGSKGNALWLQSGKTCVMVDCGLSCRETEKRMKACDIDPDAVSAVLFTHNHADHCKGVGTFRKRHPQIPFYANGGTAEAIAAVTGVQDGWAVFETAEPFEIGAFTITSFSIPHDAADPVGYLFDDGASRFVLCTDCGMPTLAVKDALARATCAMLESNHDSVLLQTSGRAPSLIQRIAGRCGHLSNADAADLVREVAPRGLTTLLLAHLSEDCNAPHLAEEAMRAALCDIGRPQTVLAALRQHEPSDLYAF